MRFFPMSATIQLLIARSIRYAAVFSTTVLISCTTPRTYDSIETGQFHGSLNLRWVAPDRFVYVPDPNQPFRFTRANGETIETRFLVHGCGINAKDSEYSSGFFTDGICSGFCHS